MLSCNETVVFKELVNLGRRVRAARRQNVKSEAGSNALVEVDQYLVNSSLDVFLLIEYLFVCKRYVTMNTSLLMQLWNVL